MADKHAFLSPSAAARWMECPAAPTLEHFYPKTETRFMSEGTLAHAYAAAELARQCYDEAGARPYVEDLEVALKVDPQADTYDTTAMEAHAYDYAQYILDLIDSLPGSDDRTVLIEHRVTLTDALFGTADCIAIKGNTLIVADYKYGEGYRVDAKNNPQLMIYALGALDHASAIEHPISRVIICIFQPRAGGAALWSLSADTLQEWGSERLYPAAVAALNPVAMPVTGDHCRWCGARALCAAKGREAGQMAGMALRRPDPRLMNASEIGHLLDLIDTADLSGWIAALGKQATSMAKEPGGRIPGWMLAPGRQTRYVSDPEALAGRLREAGADFDQIYRVATLTDLEKSVGKKKFAALSDGCIGYKQGAMRLIRDENAAEYADKRVREDFSGIDTNNL